MTRGQCGWLFLHRTALPSATPRQLLALSDNISLTRAAYVEFDLQAMMDGESYSDFFLLYLLCHQSRVEVPEDKTPEHCWLEKWYNTAAQQGVRALDQLREGVQHAIEALAGGFLAHPANTQLRERLRSGELSTQDYYRQVLRQIYRLLFLFVAEDRDLLFDPNAPTPARQVYTDHYSTRRLRELAQKRRGTRHPDSFRMLRLLFEKLRTGCSELALPALGSFLFSQYATAVLNEADIANCDLLAAIRHLAFTVDRNVLRPVNYRNLGPEELGSVYESLLEMHPEINLEAATFALNIAAGSERKTTGSYYTPSSLVNCLLESALDPVLDEACKKEYPEQALLDLKICDPACGSGHFLIAAAHRVAKRLASIRAGEDEPAPESVNQALRDCIGRCIYGVDINPMSVELCKVSLWIEALEPGKALSFLDHHIQCGNSLLGTTPALLKEGIPDDAFKPIEGDDKKVCSQLKKENREERKGQRMLWGAMPSIHLGNMAQTFANLNVENDSDLDAVSQKEKHYYELVKSTPYENARLLADAWYVAFVIPKTSSTDLAVTSDTIRRLEDNPNDINPHLKKTILELHDQYQFFHWHIAFPDVFRLPAEDEEPENEQTGWIGGFDCVLGNPPWERIKLQEKEWFAQRDPEIANAPNAARRRKMIQELKGNNPVLYQAFLDDKRKVEGESHLVRDSDCYPLCGRGDVNTYTIFAELKRSLLNPTGRVGCIVPSGIATDDTTKYFFQDLMKNRSLSSLYDFENRKGIFPAVHRSYKFCLLTLTGLARPADKGADFVFFALDVADLAEDFRHFTLAADEISLLNPNTRTCPIFRSKKDAELTKYFYKRTPARSEKDWNYTLFTMLHSSAASDLFMTSEDLDEIASPYLNSWIASGEKYLPLYEGKMFHQFDHRFANVEMTDNLTRPAQPIEISIQERLDPNMVAMPRVWVDEDEIGCHCPEDVQTSWFLGFKDITAATNERTLLATVLPQSAIVDSINLIGFSDTEKISSVPCLLANLNSFVLDYIVRQKIGGVHIKFYVLRQIPIVSPYSYTQPLYIFRLPIITWILPRILELVYTAFDLKPFGNDCSYDGPPFKWDEERRFLIRCELDAAYFYLYLGTPEEWQKQGTSELLKYFPTPREAVECIMETFPIVKRKDEQAYGEYRTKRKILEIYDSMADAIRTDKPYQTILDPPPGPPADADGNFLSLPDWQPGQPQPPNWPTHIHPPKEFKISEPKDSR